MGKGNWIPCTPAREHNPNSFQGFFYLSMFSPAETPDQDEIEKGYEDLQEFIEGILNTIQEEGKEFSKVGMHESDKLLESARRNSKDSLVMFESDQLLVLRDREGDWLHYGLGVVVKESVYFEDSGDHNKDPGDAEEFAEKVFGLLAKAFRLTWDRETASRVALWSSTWTSTPCKTLKYPEFTQWEIEKLSETWLGERVDELRAATDPQAA